MSITRVAGADRGAGFVAPIRLVLPDLLFVLLAVYNAIRLFRHAMWRDELQSPPATRRSISSPTLNMKAIPGSCICCCGDHALHHRSGRDASVASCHRARRLGADLAPLALPAGGSGSISWSAGPTRACCSASALWRCKLAAPSASGHGCCLARSPTPCRSTSRSGLSCRSSLPLSVMCCTSLGERLPILPPHLPHGPGQSAVTDFWRRLGQSAAPGGRARSADPRLTHREN